MKRVAALCVARQSAYKGLPGVECFDIERDVRTFAGDLPVVAHPPCRAWSAYCAHQAKPLPGEKDLGPLCVAWLKRCGGILEHPAHSRLFTDCQLPKPGYGTRNGLWTIEVWQSWWGNSATRKKTWLCFSGIRPEVVNLPGPVFDLKNERRAWQKLSKTQRAATSPEFAVWLVNLAGKARVQS